MFYSYSNNIKYPNLLLLFFFIKIWHKKIKININNRTPLNFNALIKKFNFSVNIYDIPWTVLTSDKTKQIKFISLSIILIPLRKSDPIYTIGT